MLIALIAQRNIGLISLSLGVLICAVTDNVPAQTLEHAAIQSGIKAALLWNVTSQATLAVNIS
jgi:hypothetical protein